MSASEPTPPGIRHRCPSCRVLLPMYCEACPTCALEAEMPLGRCRCAAPLLVRTYAGTPCCRRCGCLVEREGA